MCTFRMNGSYKIRHQLEERDRVLSLCLKMAQINPNQDGLEHMKRIISKTIISDDVINKLSLL